MKDYFKKRSLYGQYLIYEGTVELSQKIAMWLLRRNTMLFKRLSEIIDEIERLEKEEG